MKKIFLLSFAISGLFANAQQKNILHEADFWKSNPSVASVKAEIAKGNSPSDYNTKKMDAPTLAILNNASLDVIKYLVEQPGNNVNKITHEERTYLHWAAIKGNTQAIGYLLEKGSDINLEEEHGLTAAYLAASNGGGNINTFKIFLKHGLDIKKKYKNGANILLLAIPNDTDFNLTEFFVSKGLSYSDTDENGNSAINYAARGGNINAIKKLINKGVTYNEQALVFAAQGTRRTSNTIEIYKYLVDELKITPTVTTDDGENVLHMILKKQVQPEIVEYFLNKGVNINEVDNEGNTPFIIAASNKDKEILQVILPKVKDINAVNKKGESALTNAVNSNNGEVVSYLISQGADVNVKDIKGYTLTYHLVEAYRTPRGPVKTDDFTDKLTILQKNGLNPGAEQKDGNTLYHIAASKNDLALLKKIAAFNVDVNAVNNEGMTVLHKAALVAKDDEILKYLLSINARRDIKTQMEESVYDLAKENEYLSRNNISIEFLK